MKSVVLEKTSHSYAQVSSLFPYICYLKSWHNHSKNSKYTFVFSTEQNNFWSEVHVNYFSINGVVLRVFIPRNYKIARIAAIFTIRLYSHVEE